MIERTTLLPFALPELGEAEQNEIREVVESGWITTGPKAHRFEREFASYVGAKFAVAVNSCTAAMHLALEAVGLQAGDVVVTTPYTFAATAEVVRYFNAIPVFVDVEPDTLNMDPRIWLDDRGSGAVFGKRPKAEDGRGGARTEKWLGAEVGAIGDSARWTASRGPKAVMPVDMAGHPCDMDAISAIADKHALAIVEDAAHACSASLNGRLIGGTIGGRLLWASCFSFYATKTLATGEGGMVTTDNEEWADRIRVMSLHGISKSAWKRYTADGTCIRDRGSWLQLQHCRILPPRLAWRS